MMTHHNLNNLYKSSSHVNLPQQQKQEELVCVGESAPPLCKVVLGSMTERELLQPGSPLLLSEFSFHGSVEGWGRGECST